MGLYEIYSILSSYSTLDITTLLIKCCLIYVYCLSEPDVGMTQQEAQRYFGQLIKGVVSAQTPYSNTLLKYQYSNTLLKYLTQTPYSNTLLKHLTQTPYSNTLLKHLTQIAYSNT